MAFVAAQIEEKPDLLCTGVIKSVKNVRESKNGVWSVLDIEVQGTDGSKGRDDIFYLTFEPEWFEAGFDPASLREREPIVNKVGKEYSGDLRYRMFGNTVFHSKRPSLLQSLAGGPGGLAEIGEALENATGPVDRGTVEQVLAEHLSGNTVVYFMQQDKDEDGSLRDQYRISRFVEPSEEGVAYALKTAKKGRKEKDTNRQVPCVITWDE